MPWYAGGAFQYEKVLLDALAEVALTSADEISCLARPDENLHNLVADGGLSYRGLPLRSLGAASFQQRPLETYLNQPPQVMPALDSNVIYLDRGMAKLFRGSGIDWVFQLQPSETAFSALVPFVMPIHDLQHRLQPEFPEVSAHGQTEYRDYLYRNACRYATLILVESEHGKQDVLRFYGDAIGEDRIRVLPLYPPIRQGGMPSESDLQRVRANYGLPPRYFFYPAQFWRHKNHRLILQALRRIEEETGETIPLVLSGTYVDPVRAIAFKEMMDFAVEIGVRDRVSYLGWVPDEDMPALYRLSAGLVMPTFFGPSNIPALEAWNYGRPVITSDIPGLREQTGDAGLLVDPRSPEQLAAAMLRLWRDEAFGNELAERGRRRLAACDWADFVRQVGDIVADASARVQDGRSPRYPAAEL
ncbi:glycosyltransferase involved in cell wall biosynthesis [Azospirillum agricola]|uniref:glycosyltransferase family 4 protein n=1 Tax=Azospirillum agricola TaxID=1720247 RepID=UPI001AE36FD6|nr:glycosyltransferase family 1 protein [Azospirillum agricola]MBP2233299.1 glycosyltransferase involved in cell wall biosynthesis [Azospirillum agricola]